VGKKERKKKKKRTSRILSHVKAGTKRSETFEIEENRGKMAVSTSWEKENFTPSETLRSLSVHRKKRAASPDSFGWGSWAEKQGEGYQLLRRQGRRETGSMPDSEGSLST